MANTPKLIEIVSLVHKRNYAARFKQLQQSNHSLRCMSEYQDCQIVKLRKQLAKNNNLDHAKFITDSKTYIETP